MPIGSTLFRKRLYGNTLSQRNPESDANASGSGNFILELILGGGSKKSKVAFLDLVRNHHKKTTVKQVIITDPYFLRDIDVKGGADDYRNTVEYLQALGIDKNGLVEQSLPSQRKEDLNGVQIPLYDGAIDVSSR